MVYRIVYKKSVTRDLRKLPKVEMIRVLDKIEKELRKYTEKNPVLKRRFAGLRRLRIGDHRVIYALIENNILILRIGNRKDIYKNEKL